MKGVLNKEYARARQKKRSHIYRLKRRTYEVIKSIRDLHPKPPDTILDLGAADGLMLDSLKKAFPNTVSLGIEYTKELIRCNKNKGVYLLQGDAQILPVKDNVIDIVIATAIIEHIPEQKRLIDESFRVLKKNGIFIITTPHPFWEKVASWTGHLKEEEHHTCITLKTLGLMLHESGFTVARADCFMLSPVGMPLELFFEGVLKLCKLNFLLANQKIVGKKNGKDS